MRISTRQIYQNALRGVQAGQQSLADAQAESTTGKKIRTVSDDPSNATQIMRLNGNLRAIDQYRRNGTSASTQLSAEDAVLTSAGQALETAKSLAVSGATTDPTDPQRTDALKQAQVLLNQLVSLGNTKVGNDYILGGTATQTPPFQADGTYVGDGNTRQSEVEDGYLVPTNHPGDQVLGSAISEVKNLIQQLQTGTPASIQATGTGLSSAQQGVLSIQAESGGWQQQIQAAGDRLAQRSGALLDQRAALGDADPAESAVKVVAAQNALQQAYAAVGKILSINFLDYLR